MRKYYYYSFRSGNGVGNGVIFTDESCFEVFEEQMRLEKKHGAWCIITFWHEISCAQYEKMKEYFDNQNK